MATCRQLRRRPAVLVLTTQGSMGAGATPTRAARPSPPDRVTPQRPRSRPGASIVAGRSPRVGSESENYSGGLGGQATATSEASVCVATRTPGRDRGRRGGQRAVGPLQLSSSKLKDLSTVVYDCLLLISGVLFRLGRTIIYGLGHLAERQLMTTGSASVRQYRRPSDIKF